MSHSTLRIWYEGEKWCQKFHIGLNYSSRLLQSSLRIIVYVETGKHLKSDGYHNVSLCGLFIRWINRIIYVPAFAFYCWWIDLAIWYYVNSLQTCFIWKMECGPVWFKPVKMRDVHNRVIWWGWTCSTAILHALKGISYHLCMIYWNVTVIF